MSKSKLNSKTNVLIEKSSSRHSNLKTDENNIKIFNTEKQPVVVKYKNKKKIKYPELYAYDVSTHPSYTGLKNLPYHVVCRQRLQQVKLKIKNQLDKEIKHMAMMQSYALGGVRLDRMLTVGFSPKSTKIPDFATKKQRQRINTLLNEK